MQIKLVKRKVAVIIFYDNEGNILLQDRKNYSKHGEEYGFFGGKMEKGETPEQALKREMREELELDIKDYRLFKKYRRIIPEINRDVIMNVFLSKIPDVSSLKVNEGGLALMKFKDSFKLKMLPGNVELLKEIYKFLSLKKKK